MKPRGMPQLRADTAQSWAEFSALRRGSAERILARHDQLGLAPPQARRRDLEDRDAAQQILNSAEEFAVMARALTLSSLWWVTHQMMKLAQEAGPSLPEWSPSMYIPDMNGLLLWENTLGTVPWTMAPDSSLTRDAFGKPAIPLVETHGMAWSTRAGTVRIAMVSRNRELAKESGFPEIAGRPVLTPVAYLDNVPLYGVQPPDNTDREAPLLAVIGATWGLMQQPTLVSTKMTNGPVLGRGADPADTNDVTLVDLRRVQQVRDGATDPSGSHLTNRHIVRGHWRQQACGPEHSLRKPIWIAPHIKGPDDGKLVTGEIVNVWRK